MAITLPDARQLSDEVLEALRLRALRGCEMGLSEGQVADLLGVARETVSRWWAAYRQAGVQALPGGRTGRPQGSGRLLDERQAARIQGLIDSNSPDKLGIAAALWSRRAVRDLIAREFGIRLAARTVGKYLKRWGYTAKRPRRHAKKQVPEEVKEFLEKTYPQVQARAARERGIILWCDEAGVAADEHPGVGYARRGQAASMEVPPPHIRVNVVAAIGNAGQLRFMTYKGTLDAALFCVFLGRLLRTTTRKVFLFVDRLRAHEAAEVTEWLKRHKGRIEVILLPRYSPELNAEEYLNNDLKSNIHNFGMPDNKEELRRRIFRFLRWLYHWPARVARYFRHPCVSFAAAAAE